MDNTIVHLARRGGKATLMNSKLDVIRIIRFLVKTEFKYVHFTDNDICSIMYSYLHSKPNNGSVVDNIRECIRTHVNYLLEVRGYL